MLCPSTAPSIPRSPSYKGPRGGKKIRCLSWVAVPARDPLTELSVGLLRLVVELLQEESGVPIPDARAKDLFAQMAKVEAGIHGLGLIHPTPLCVRATEPEPAAPPHVAHADATPDDRFVDQRSGLLPKVLYLRLAREGAFPSSKIGKRVVARWGDVRVAVEARRRKIRSPEPRNGTGTTEHSNLDALRRRLNLCPKRRG
jgi:hypothetical protein